MNHSNCNSFHLSIKISFMEKAGSFRGSRENNHSIYNNKLAWRTKYISKKYTHSTLTITM